MKNKIVVKFDRHRVKKKKMLHNLLMEHMVPGFYKIDDFRDGQAIDAEKPNSKIRINMYYTPEKCFFINTFSIRAGLVQALRNPNKTFTVFAPTDSAFSHPFLASESNTNERCTVSVMKHHIIDHMICSSAIPRFAKSLNMIGELLSLSRDEYNKLYVDDVQIVVKDLVGTNGVVHIIDGVLSTRQAKGASEVLEEYGLNEFLKLLEVANLKNFYDSLENVTFFIPSNEAIRRN
ncbi:UNVERIFIED_CONTAM: Stab2 [Trichonephila clavipes]